MWTATKAETFACKLKGVHSVNDQDAWLRSAEHIPYRPSPDSPASSSLVSVAVRKPQRRRDYHNLHNDRGHPQAEQDDKPAANVHGRHVPALMDSSSEALSPMGVGEYERQESSSRALKVHYDNKLFTPSTMGGTADGTGAEVPEESTVKRSFQSANAKQKGASLDCNTMQSVVAGATDSMHAEHAIKRGATQKWLNAVELPHRLNMQERRIRTADSAELSRARLQRKLVPRASTEASRTSRENTQDSSFMQQQQPRLAEKCTSRARKGVITTFVSVAPPRSTSCSHRRSHSSNATHANMQSAFADAEHTQPVSGQANSGASTENAAPMANRSFSEAVTSTRRASAVPGRSQVPNNASASPSPAAVKAATSASVPTSDRSRHHHSAAHRSGHSAQTTTTRGRSARARARNMPRPATTGTTPTAPPRSDPHPKLSPTRIPLPPCMRRHSACGATLPMLPTVPSLSVRRSSSLQQKGDEGTCDSPSADDPTDTLNLDPHYPVKASFPLTDKSMEPTARYIKNLTSDAPKGASEGPKGVGVLSVSSCASTTAAVVLRSTASDSCTPHASSLHLCSMPSTMPPGPASGRSTTPTVPASPTPRWHHNIVEAGYEEEEATQNTTHRTNTTQPSGTPSGYVTLTALPGAAEEHSRPFLTPRGEVDESSDSTRVCVASHQDGGGSHAQQGFEAATEEASEKAPVTTKRVSSAAFEKELAKTRAAASRAAAAHSAKVAALVPRLRLNTPPKELEFDEIAEITPSQSGEAVNAEVMASLQQRIRARHSQANSAPYLRRSRLSAHFASADRTTSENVHRSRRSVASSGRRSISTHSLALSHQSMLEDGVKVNSDSQTTRKSVKGFDVNSADACCSATTWKQMTNDVDFGAVSQGTKHKWFLKGARKLFERDAPRPVASHGCSASLASVHRRAPPLACARRVVNKNGQPHIRLRPTSSYESVGVWRDSDNRPCLVIQAHFADGGHKMMMLYEECRMHVSPVAPLKSFRDLPECSEGQWCTLPMPCDAAGGGTTVE